MENLTCKIYGHDIQCMSPMGADNEYWGCTRCGIEESFDDGKALPFTIFQTIIWKIKENYSRGKFNRSFNKLEETDDIPF